MICIRIFLLHHFLFYRCQSSTGDLRGLWKHLPHIKGIQEAITKMSASMACLHTSCHLNTFYRIVRIAWYSHLSGTYVGGFIYLDDFLFVDTAMDGNFRIGGFFKRYSFYLTLQTFFIQHVYAALFFQKIFIETHVPEYWINNDFLSLGCFTS